jgi:Zn-dependent metalloprotease
MKRFLHRPVVALSLLVVLALGGMGAAASHQRTGVGPQQLAAIRAAQPALVQQALENVVARRAELGIGEKGGFQVRAAFTNPQGQVVTRMNQTFAGARVWGGEAIAHVLPGGEIRTQTQDVQQGVALSGEPAVSQQQAIDIALRHFAAKGALAHATAERVVFPNRFVGGLATRWDPKTHQATLDRSMSIFHRTSSAPYVWAWEVKVGTMNRQDGPREMAYIVDGTTGAFLRKSDQRKAITNFPSMNTTPSTATGLGLYAGAITLDSSVDENGVNWLQDMTRATLPLPFLRDIGFYYGYPGATTGLFGMYQDGYNYDPNYGDNTGFYSSATPSFGDGEPYLGVANSPNGQTAVVDAQFSTTKTWDFLQQIFGRMGPDGLGTSVGIMVHAVTGADPVPYDGSYYNNNFIVLGDHPDPSDPTVYRPYAEPDVVAHEFGHAIIASTALLYGTAYESESAGIAEGFCDAMGEAVEAFAYGTPRTNQYGQSLIPSDGNDWYVGARVTNGHPFRSLEKPSLDGASLETYFEGMALADGQYISGPLNRAFYFLSQGASSTPGKPDYSPYLPGGMKGVGLDSATRIWFSMVTEYLGTVSGYADARGGAISAALELFGAASNEEAAVRNAFAAINVGEAAGELPRTHVSMPQLVEHGYLYDQAPQYRTWPLVGRGTTVTLSATVSNNPDQRVTWKTGTPFASTGTKFEAGGTIAEDGRWNVPLRMGWHGMTAVSVADPLQYAANAVFIINTDCDGDSENDAIDMGGVAIAWNLYPGSNFNTPSPSVNSVFYAPWVDDQDVASIVQALTHTAPAPTTAH